MQTLFTLGEQPLHELLEGLEEGTIGDVTRQLVALASDEIAPLSYQRFVEFLNQRGFANAGIAGHQHTGRLALAGLLKGAQEFTELLFPTVETLRHDEEVRPILLAKRKHGNGSMACPLLGAVLKVGPQAQGTLIPLLSSLGQQLHHDQREWLGDRRRDRAGREGQLREVAVD